MKILIIFIFKATSYRKALPVRGIYMTAQLGEKVIEDPTATMPNLPPPVPGMPVPEVKDDSAPPKPVFVRQLFGDPDRTSAATLSEWQSLFGGAGRWWSIALVNCRPYQNGRACLRFRVVNCRPHQNGRGCTGTVNCRRTLRKGGAAIR